MIIKGGSIEVGDVEGNIVNVKEFGTDIVYYH